VAVLVRLYSEADSAGKILSGYQNSKHSLYHLPRITHNPLDYWMSESILGHVRLKPLPKIGRRKVTRMFKEEDPSDRADLIQAHLNDEESE
jgi:hypothetical protein